MTAKCALAGLPAGGGKTTIIAPADTDVDWPAAYRALGDVIGALDGQYVCGPDVGTGNVELDWVRERTRHVNPEGNDAGTSTAAGVLSGLDTIWKTLGESGARGRRVAIQGLGAVGSQLAAALVEQGADVWGSDVSPAACQAAAGRGVHIVPPESVLAVECDVVLPCAMGHGLTQASVAALRCRAVCGSANNQLASVEAAWDLQRRGIVHAPDEVVSAGAVIEGVLTVLHGQGATARGQVSDTIAGIARVLAEVLTEAEQSRRPPCLVARERGG